MINNQNELGDLETRAGDIKNIAFNVKNNADQLRKEAARRNTRVMILTAVVGVAILAYIILPLVYGQWNISFELYIPNVLIRYLWSLFVNLLNFSIFTHIIESKLL